MSIDIYNYRAIIHTVFLHGGSKFDHVAQMGKVLAKSWSCSPHHSITTLAKVFDISEMVFNLSQLVASLSNPESLQAQRAISVFFKSLSLEKLKKPNKSPKAEKFT